jgi:hypothetical protein
MQVQTQNLTDIFAGFSGAQEAEFQYGWCYTDAEWKNDVNTAIMPQFREHDYMRDEPYATQIKNILQQLGLPLPKPEEIYHGTHHDLLFLNSHGVVLRVGPTEAEELINPGFLQPLGWVETELKVKNVTPKQYEKFASQQETAVSVVIYPGIELFPHWRKSPDRPKNLVDYQGFVQKTGQTCLFDQSEFNKGVIRVADDDGHEAAVVLLADVENEWNAPSPELAQRRSASLRQMEARFDNKADAIAQMMEEVFGGIEGFKYLQRAFEAHQPLRRLFWEAFGAVKGPSDKPDPAKMNAFWEACASVNNNPAATTMPCWHQETDAAGKTVFIREEACVPHVVLYHPWTGDVADNATQPLRQTPVLAAAVQQAHARQSGGTRQRQRTTAMAL